MESDQMGSTVILPDFVLPSRANQHWQYSGIDSIEHCLNKDHFQSYPYSIEYAYNSRGYRDAEWPDTLDELKRAIWCFGDSFTVGVGQPFEHTWPQVLSKKLGRRTINVSMDGASNDWIVRKVKRIVETIDPTHIVILWSYTHRRELPDSKLTDEQRILLSSKSSSRQDDLHWIELTKQIQNLNSCALQATIPRFQGTYDYSIERHWNTIKGSSWPSCPLTVDDLEKLPEFIKAELNSLHGCYHNFKTILTAQQNTYSIDSDNNVLLLPNNIIYCRQQLDWARDYHHFDLLTAEWLVNQICQQFEC